MRQERTHFVLDRRDRLGTESPEVLLVLIHPEVTHRRTRDPSDRYMAKAGLVEEPEDVRERRFGLIKKGK